MTGNTMFQTIEENKNVNEKNGIIKSMIMPKSIATSLNAEAKIII